MKKIVIAAAATALAACGVPADPPQNERALSGVAPAGTERLLVIDAEGRAFDAAPDAAGAFRVLIDSTRPVSLFVVGNGATRVLRVAAAPGEVPSLTMLPEWNGEVSTAQLSTADANEDGIDEEVIAEENPLDSCDSDEDGTSDFEDDDDDNDGESDEADSDDDGDGSDDDDNDLDSDDDDRPDLCDEDDDNDGVSDDEDEDEAEDSDDDGIDDDEDADDDNDAEHDDDDSDDDGDGAEDDAEDDEDEGTEDDGSEGTDDGTNDGAGT